MLSLRYCTMITKHIFHIISPLSVSSYCSNFCATRFVF
uniref:Uncharacterized protein n=1 Tax=Arundo donax TaxID=35708 RepID=A0A0A9GGD6_ARUDO